MEPALRPHSDDALAPSAPGPPGAPAVFHGRRIIAVGIAAQTLGIGLIGAYQFFVTPLIDEFGLDKASVGLGMSLFALTSASLSPFLGMWLDRSGSRVRAYMLAGVLAMGLGMFALSTAGSPAQLVAASLLVFAGIILYGPLPVHVLIVNWFSRQRGQALALAALGISLPGFFIPGLSVWLIDAFGWRGALRALGLGCALLLLPLLWAWVVSRPEDVGQTPDGAAPVKARVAADTASAGLTFRVFVRDRNFWIIAIGIGLIVSAHMLNGVYLVRHMEESQISRAAAAQIVTWIAVFAVIGKLVTARIADRIDKRLLAWGLVALQLASWGLILEMPSYTTLLIAGVGFGLGLGGFTPLPALFVGTWFGRAAFGQITGLMSSIRLPATLSMVPFGGWVADRTGDHAATFLLAIGVVAVGAVLLAFLRKAEPAA